MRHLMRFLRATDGAIALRFAFVAPAVFLLVVGGLDLLSVNRSQDRLQTIAEGAAAAAARTVASNTDLAVARADASAFVAAEMRQWSNAPFYEARYEIVDRGGQQVLRVILHGHRTSFLANMLPPGGWKFVGDSDATPA